VFTYRPTSLLATNRASVFFFIYIYIYVLALYISIVSIDLELMCSIEFQFFPIFLDLPDMF